MGKLFNKKKTKVDPIKAQMDEALEKTMPKFPEPPKEKPGSSGKEKQDSRKVAMELTKKQKQEIEIEQKILEQQAMLRDNGIFRLNLLDQLTKQNELREKQNDISIELGQSLIDEMEGIKKALQKLGEGEEKK